MAYSEIINNKPVFSVIMPLYNKEAYVEKALKSVLSQSFKDWELIVVNDGSTDGSLNVASKVIEGDSRCRIINQDNAGVGAARNNGATESKGEYLCFLDADDWWDEMFLEEMSIFSAEYPDAGIWASNYWYVRNGKNRIGVNTKENGYINYPKMYYTTGNMPIWTGAVCMHRNIFEINNGFPEKIKLGEDFLLWSRITLKNKVAFLNKPLSFYNNDVPNSLRLSRKLHEPKEHMLWYMDTLEMECLKTNEAENWKELIEWLRVNGLLDYWLDGRFHYAAANELKKVKNTLPSIYHQPIWVVKVKRMVLRIGSIIKQRIQN